MTVPEQPDERQSDQSKTTGKGLTRTGLSPTVERMFGALVGEYEDTGPNLSSEMETPPVSRPGAA